MTTQSNKAGTSPPTQAGQVRSPLPNVVSSTKQGAEGRRKPASAWKNKWWVDVPITIATTGATRDAGEFFTADIYATAELAEQKAMEGLASNTRAQRECGLRYLGPVPAGDA